MQRLQDYFYREPVSPEAIALYRERFQQISDIASRTQSLYRSKFGSAEFLSFVRLNQDFQDRSGPYHELKPALALLQAGIGAHQAFTNLEQIEFNHRGKRFNEFYSFVESLCHQRVQATTFRRQTQAKFQDLFPILKSQEGKLALKRYHSYLERIASNDLSLNLLYAFKKYQFQGYNIFRKLADIVKDLRCSDILSQDSLSLKIITHFESFDKLGLILGIPSRQQTLETYGLLFQYIALSEKHARAFEQFKSLVDQLQHWYEVQVQLVTIRQQYPPQTYRYPKLLRQELPGQKLYNQYAAYLGEPEEAPR